MALTGRVTVEMGEAAFPSPDPSISMSSFPINLTLPTSYRVLNLEGTSQVSHRRPCGMILSFSLHSRSKDCLWRGSTCRYIQVAENPTPTPYCPQSDTNSLSLLCKSSLHNLIQTLLCRSSFHNLTPTPLFNQRQFAISMGYPGAIKQGVGI